MNRARLTMGAAILVIGSMFGVGAASAARTNGKPTRPSQSLVNHRVAPPVQLPTAAQAALDQTTKTINGQTTDQAGVHIPTDFFAVGKAIGLSDNDARAFAARSEAARGTVTDTVSGK